MKKERLTAEEILDLWLNGFTWIAWSKENAIKAMKAFAAQEVAAIEMPTEEDKFIRWLIFESDLQKEKQRDYAESEDEMVIRLRSEFRSRMEEKK